MKTSDKTGELVKALLAAQPELGKVVKKHKVDAGRQKYTYAKLEDVLEACETTLHKHELIMVQSAEMTDTTAGVVTRIWHSSGEWIESDLFLPINDVTYWKDGQERVRPAGPQECGSAITYARRYALMAMLGLAAEDDDGAAAQPAAKKGAKKNGKPPSTNTRTAPPTDHKRQIKLTVEAFGKYGIEEGELVEVMGRGLETLDETDVDLLRSIWRRVKEAAEAGDDVREPIREHLELNRSEAL